MEDIVVKTIAAFLNTDGGKLLIGVDDDRNVIGLGKDLYIRAGNSTRQLNARETVDYVKLRWP